MPDPATPASNPTPGQGDEYAQPQQDARVEFDARASSEQSLAGLSTAGESQAESEAEADADAADAADAEAPKGTSADLDYVKPEPEYIAVELAPGAEVDDRGPTAVTTNLRRGVNMRGWLILGLALGVVLAFVLTYSFPEPEQFLPGEQEFTRGQVLGFFLVFVTALTTIVVVGIAGIIDWILGRRTRKVTLTRAD
ncbi:hypothetical protein [Gulosibacter faecalis]|jgi:hypothetical protein|uniref:MFS transporter n=1 Tax=Gulosibacter faecalis TaxID=272240 RepID=A0ABW5UY57_9MICO|nr:hypothetical protein [Gulosibacter faecalis]